MNHPGDADLRKDFCANDMQTIGGVNDDMQGYHETITRVFVMGVRRYLARTGETGLLAAVNDLLANPEGRRDWPLRFYSRERLFSVEARRDFVPPDLASLDEG